MRDIRANKKSLSEEHRGLVEVLTVLAPGLVTGVRRVRDTGKAADVLRAANFTNARCGGGYDILADRARLEALCARAPGNATVARRA